MGGKEGPLSGGLEPAVRYHPVPLDGLTILRGTGGRTVLGGQFDWGGRLLKGNGGVQRSPQAAWKPADECKGRRWLDCESDSSSRWETRA